MQIIIILFNYYSVIFVDLFDKYIENEIVIIGCQSHILEEEQK